LRNAAVAIAAMRALPVDLPGTAFVEGVRTACAPARLQRFVHEGVEIVVDVGHNPQAARALADWLAAAPVDGPVHAVFAVLGDKDVAGVVEALASRIDRWWLAGLADVAARGLAVDAFAATLQDTAAAEGARCATVDAAIDAALRDTPAGGRILIFGSFHTAGAALSRFGGGT
jgi:dihydrofolate synthase/folylpolyglutamate synthase